MTKRIAVLVSGRGSNLQALLHAQAEGRLGGRIALVLSDKPNCLGIKRAREAGCETFTFSPKEFSDRESYERVMAREIESRECVLIVLAGFMRILTPWFVKRFEGRLINLHPALLPQFPGTHAI
ncbi:MAG: phosphoribosylglycinamide formyltransferase, partial [Candidatus Hydrogenedentota bacterium]